MTSTQLRRLTTQKPDENVRVTNTLVDMLLGNGTGRIYLNGDGGLEKALQGGATLATLVPALMIRPDSGEQAWLKHSNDVDTVFRAQDAGVTMSNGTFSGNVLITGTLGVTGLLTAVNLTTTGNTVLGNAIGDTVAISGPTTVGGTLGVTGITTLNNLLKIPGGAHYIEMGATPSTTGTIRGSSTFQIRARNTGDTVDIELISTDGLDVAVGGVNARDLYIQCNNEMSHYVGGELIIHTDADGIGFNGVLAVVPPTLSGSAAASYDATTRNLINAIRDCLQDNGLAT